MSKQTKSAAPAKNAKPAKQTKSKEVDENSFISEDALASGSAKYMKFEKGDSKFRALSMPISGWVEWIDKKPVRTSLADGEPEASDDENPPKKFTALVVLDRKDDEVKILELTQQSVIKAIRALANNPDWGNPFTYDINITKTGEGMKTKYAVQPSPKKPLSKDEIEICKASPCDLEKLMEGEDPWKTEEHVTEYHYFDTGKR